MLTNKLKEYSKYLKLVFKLYAITCVALSALMVMIIIISKWVVVHGHITLVFSPLGYHYEYFGFTRSSKVLNSIMYLSLIPGLMILALSIALIVAYIRDAGIDTTLGVLYAYIIVFFVYSYIIVPHTWYRLNLFLSMLGVRQGRIIVDTLAGVLELGKVSVSKWEPLQYTVNGFILCVLGSFYGIYKGMYEE